MKTSTNTLGSDNQYPLSAHLKTELSTTSRPQAKQLKTIILFVLSVFVMLGISSNIHAATKTWVSTVGGAWTTAGNWSPSGVPAAGDDVVVNTTQSGNITSVPGITLNSLTITGTCLFSAGNSGSTITITNSFYVSSGVTFTLGVSSHRLNFTLNGIGTNAGAIAYDGGSTPRNFTINGTLTMLSSGRIYDPNLSAGSCLTVNSGATLKIGHSGGILPGGQTSQNSNVAICLGGTITYSTGAKFEYIGTSAQVTGTGCPATVASLVINNTAGVALTSAIAVTGNLEINSGSVLNLNAKNSTANTLSFISVGQVAGTWGGTGSGATNINSTYFTAGNTGKITVASGSTPSCILNLTSATNTDNQTFCPNSPITDITYATTTATGATVTGLPTGVTSSWASNILTISGTPTVTGNYSYLATLTGGGCSTTAIGTLLSSNTLSYKTPNFFPIGVAITALSPTKTGTISAYSVSPALPTGLSLNTSTGVISGTPTVKTSGTYTVTGTTSCGGLTFDVEISVGSTITSAQTGNWSATTTWTGGVVPAAGDQVVILSNHTVTVNITTAVCNKLNIAPTSNNTSTLLFNSGQKLTVGGVVTLGDPGGTGRKGALTMTSGGTLVCEGFALGNTGTNTFTRGTGTVELTADNTLPATIFTNFCNLTISDGTTIPGTNLAVYANLTVSGGMLDLSTYTANRFSAGGTLTVSDGATLKIGGTNTLPSNYTTHSISCNSTIEYSGTAQTVANLNSSQTYGNLTLSGSGTKTLQTATTTICNNFSLSGTVTTTAVVGLTIGGNVTIGTGTTFAGGSYTHNIGGDWTKNGTFTTSGTINFNGTGDGDISASNFNHVTISGTGDKTATGILAIAGNVNISGSFIAGAFTHTVAGNWTNSGTFTTTGSTIEFSGGSAASIGASSFNNIIFSGAGTKTATGALAIAGYVSITGNFTAGAYTHTVGGNWSKSGTFTNTGSTIDFNGSSAQSISASDFNTILFSNAGTKTATGNINIVGNTTINSNFSAGSYTMNLQGNFTNNGTFTAGTSNIVFIGSSAQTIGGSSSTNFYNLEKKSSGVALNLGIATTISHTLTLTSGNIDLGDYNLTVSTISGGSASSYIKTSGTGRLTMNVAYPGSKTFPIGKSAFNPLVITNNTSGSSDNFNIRVADEVNTNANDSTRTIRRRWYFNKDGAGSTNITLAITYNVGEEGTNFNKADNPNIGFYPGYWATGTVTVSGTTFTGTGLISNYSANDQFLTLGSGNAFIATKLAVTSISPTNPSLGSSGTVITVRSLNSQNVPTCVGTATAFNLSCANTTFTPATPTGTISANAYETTVTGVTFTTSTIDLNPPYNYLHNATVTAIRTSGESLTAGTSAVFDVIKYTIYEPVATENWNASNGWRKSIDGGITWTNPATLPGSNVFATTDVIRIPAGITLTANVTASFYSMLIYGTLDINSSGSLTLNHNSSDEYDIYTEGTLKNSGGTLTNTDELDDPIKFYGGTYWHARNGGSIPTATWNTNGGTPSTCNVTGITSTALTAGLSQSFQNFTWNNASQAVVQSLSADMNVSGALTLTNGTITSGSYYVIIGLTGSTARTNGYISGNLRIYIPGSTNPTVNFPIGDSSNYAPFSIVLTGAITGNGYLDVSTAADQPPLASGLSQTKYVNRKWRLVNNNVTGITTINPSMTFTNGDKIGSPTTLVLRRQITNSWYTTNGTVTGNTMTATSLQPSGTATITNYYIGEETCNSSNAIWQGTTSTDWNTASNWCGGSVPTATTDITIPSSATNQPIIGAAGGTCNNITLESGASLEITGTYTLNVKGSWNNSGSFTANSSSVSFTGATAQTINGNNTFYNLTVNNSSGVTATADQTVNNTLTLTSANPSSTKGALDMGSYKVILIGNNSAVAGTGDVTGNFFRPGPFLANKDYTMGNQSTTFNMPFGIGTVTNVNMKTTIGSVPSWKSNAIKREYEVTNSPGAGPSNMVIAFHYLDSELNGANENNLTLWIFNGVSATESGRTSSYISGNLIAIGPTDVSAYPYLKLTFAPTEQPLYVWSGAVNTDWNTAGNWVGNAVPVNTSNVVIPNTTNKPQLPASTVEIKTMKIETGAILNAASGTVIKVYGGSNANDPDLCTWACEGTFNAGSNSTVSFLGTNASYSGVCNFNNISIESGASLLNSLNSVMGISGTITQTGNWNASYATNSSVTYNGSGSQYIIQPNHGTAGYRNLIISGTGNKSLSENISIWGDFTNNGTFVAGSNTVSITGLIPQTISGSSTPVFNNLTINNPYGVSSTTDLTVNGTMYLQSDNPASLDKGTLDMASGKILNLGDNATTTGTSDVTGIIKRTPTTLFATNAFYSFGNTNQGVIFPVVSGQTLPTSLSLRVSIGTAPNWGGTPTNITKRLYELGYTGSPANTKAILRLNYKENELADGVNESTLSVWMRHLTDTPIDKGWSNYNSDNNYISIADINFSDFSSGTLGDYKFTVAPTSLASEVWNGIYSTDWNTAANWTPATVPTSSVGVIIPNANTTNFDPSLPATGYTQAACRFIIIESGGVLNAGNLATLTLSDGTVGAVWGCENGGVFNPNNSTIIISNNSLTNFASMSGIGNFYNLTIATGSSLRPAYQSNITIGGALTIQGSGILAAATNNNTIEFNGSSSQTIPNPNGSTPGYHNLTLSGSGAKTLPSSGTLQILGDFVSNVNCTAQSNITTTSLDNGGSNNGAAVLDMGVYTLSATSSDNTGATVKFSGASNGIAIATGTVEYYGANQTIGAGTYNNLNMSNATGTQTASGDLTVNGAFTTTSGTTLNMGTNALYGTLTSISGTSTIKTQNTSSTPIPAGKTWTQTVDYNGTAVQTAVDGTFNNITIENTAGVTMAANATAIVNNTLLINSGANLTIGTGTEMVANTVTNNAGVTGLLINGSTATTPNGTFIFTNGTPSATVEMYSKAEALNKSPYSSYKWQYFGVPLQSIVANPTFYGSYLRRYSESTGSWATMYNADVLTPFIGYEITQPNPTTIVFQGQLVNSNLSQALTYTNGTGNGQNLFSNPYTAAIDISQLTFDNDLDATVYLYNTGSHDDWLANNTSPTGYDNPGQYVAVPKQIAGRADGLPAQISSMQGFEINTKSPHSATTFSINYNSVKTKITDKQRVKSSMSGIQKVTANTTPDVYTVIDVKGSQFSDKMWLFTNETCSHNFENGWDGTKILGSALSPQIFARETDGDYQVNVVDNINNTSLAFKAGTDTTYTLTFIHQNIEAKYPALFLYDMATGGVTDISVNGTEYTFNSTSTSATTRFKILTSGDITTALIKAADVGLKIFNSDKTIFIQNSGSDNGALYVYNISGQLINKFQFAADGISSFPTRLLTGPYIVKAITRSEEQTQCIIIQ